MKFIILALFTISAFGTAEQNARLLKQNKALMELVKALNEAEVGDPVYVLLPSSSGDACAPSYQVASQDTCESAATSEGLDGITVLPDYAWGDTRYPKGCYYKPNKEGGPVMYYNQGTDEHVFEFKIRQHGYSNDPDYIQMVCEPVDEVSCESNMEIALNGNYYSKLYGEVIKSTPEHGCYNMCWDDENKYMKWGVPCKAYYKPSGGEVETTFTNGYCGRAASCVEVVPRSCCGDNDKELHQFCKPLSDGESDDCA